MSNPSNVKNADADILALKAREFLRLQAETRDWMESVLGTQLGADLHTELKSGHVLCKLMNTLFPGAVRNVHKANFAQHQIENIGFSINCLRKMGMREDELFEPLDLHEKKNMMKVFRCIASFAAICSGSGKARKWKRQKADFSAEEIAAWKDEYGQFADQMDFEGGDDVDVDVDDEAPAATTTGERGDDVDVMDSSMFPATANVTLKSLGVTLDDLIRAVDEVEKFRDDDTDKSPQDTADDTEQAAVIAAQYAAQVRAFGEQQAAAAPAGDKAMAAFKERMRKLQKAIDAANEDMVAKHNAWQDAQDEPAARAALYDACEELKRVARDAHEQACRVPARCADVVVCTDDVTDDDIDVSLAELVKAVRKAQAIDECKPHETTQRTEDGSRKAAKFAGQVKRVGDQNAHAPVFRDRMHAHADRVQDANRDFVAANNRYVAKPDSKATQREFDDACEELILAAQNAARDAKRRPPLDVKRAYASDFPVDNVTADDLERMLKEVIKTANKTEAFGDATPLATAADAETCSARAAHLESMVRWVGDHVKNKELRRKIAAAADAVDAANGDMCDAAKAYGHDEASKAKQRALTDTCEELKRVAAAAVQLGVEGLDAMALVPATFAAELPAIDGDVSAADIDVSLAELVKAVRHAQDLDSADTPNATAERTTKASGKAARFAAQVKRVGEQHAKAHPAFAERMDAHSERIQAANKDMVDACNALQNAPDDKRAQKEFDDACEELIRVATNAARDAKRAPGAPVKRSRAADFPVDNVTAEDLERALKEVVKGANRTDAFKDATPAETGVAATDASAKAAQLESMVAWVGDKVRDKELKRRIAKAAAAIDDANGDMCDAADAYMGDESAKPKQRALHDACDELKRVAAAACSAANDGLDALAVPDARLYTPAEFPQKADVDDDVVDKSAAAVSKAARRAQELDGSDVEPRDTTARSEQASKDAARFAAQCAKAGDQSASRAPAYRDKMREHADKVQAANEAVVAANNKYIREPDSRAKQRALGDACDELVRVTADAARDAKRRPPPKIKRSKASEYPTDATSKDELKDGLQEQLKQLNKLNKFADHTPDKVAANGKEASKAAAKLEAKVRCVAGDVKQKDLRKRIAATASELEDANADVVEAVNDLTGDEQSKPKQRRLRDATEKLKHAAAASVSAANDGLDSMVPDDEALRDINPNDTPLHFETLKGNIPGIKKLLEKGIKVDTTTGEGWTPLYTACYVGNLALVRFFMEQGADVNITNKEGFTPLFAAVSQGHKNVVAPLLDEYKAKVNVQSNQGTTALFHAAEGGRYTIAKLLIDAGARVDLGKEDGWTPLQGAVFNYHSKVTRLLIERGADVNKRNGELKKYTALHIAIASKKPNVDVVNMLAERGDLDVKNKNGATPLHLAAMWGHNDCVRALVAKGASMKIANNKGRQPLEVAARYGHDEVASYLASKLGVAVPNVQKKSFDPRAIEKPAEVTAPPEDVLKKMRETDFGDDGGKKK